MQNTPYTMVRLGGFKAKCTSWYKHDKTNFEGIAIENISSQCGLYQVINQPAHILENSSSCTDLKYLLLNPTLLLSQECTHRYSQIVIYVIYLVVIYAKFNLKVHYPPHVWHYKEADTNLI